MNLIILTPGKTVFEGQVVSVNTPGTSGKIEILENHAPVVASLGDGTIKIVTAAKETKEWNTSGGFLEVLNNNISILLETVKS